MKKSSRHHYIPKFLIKNFTDLDGLLFVYNKATNKIINTRQSPKSVFFERDRNTVVVGGQKLDSLEQLYSQLDNKIAVDLKNVLETKKVSPEELTSIALLANQLKWRIPRVDDKFNKIKDDLTQKDLSINISVKDESSGVDKNAIEHLENSELFKEAKRVLLPILPFLTEGETLLEIHNNSFINTNTNFPALIGDSPILERSNADIRRIEDFIFPLSSSDTFIFKKGTNKKLISPLFFLQRDMAIINSSSQYVGCSSKEYLGKVVAMYNEVKEDKKLDDLEAFLFDFIG